MNTAAEIEAEEIRKIDDEEKIELEKTIRAKETGKKRAHSELENDENDDNERIAKAFCQRMTSLIEKLEHGIISSGYVKSLGISKEDFQAFVKKVSNPEDIMSYIDGLRRIKTRESIEKDEDKVDEEEEEDGIEVVISSDEEEEEDEEDDDNGDFNFILL